MTSIQCNVILSVAAALSTSLNMPGRRVTSSDRPIVSSGKGAYIRQEISLKIYIYDEVPEDIFDKSNVTFFLKKLRRKKWGMFIPCSVFGQLKVKLSKISVVILPGYRIVGISRKLESERKKKVLRPNAAYLKS